MENAFPVLILVSLAVQLLPVVLVFEPKKDLGNTFMYVLILIAGQILLFYFGFLLGERFLHLLESYKSIVILSGFFIVGIRMILDAFKIRKGERSFEIAGLTTALLISVVIGINTFLVGLLFNYLGNEIGSTLFVLLIASIVVSLIGMLMKIGKQSLTLSAFLMFLSGMVMLVSALYLGFFK